LIKVYRINHQDPLTPLDERDKVESRSPTVHDLHIFGDRISPLEFVHGMHTDTFVGHEYVAEPYDRDRWFLHSCLLDKKKPSASGRGGKRASCNLIVEPIIRPLP
jgi:hypothetical protein